MKKILSLLLLAVFIQLPTAAQKSVFAEINQLQSPQTPRLGFMIHSGTGVIAIDQFGNMAESFSTESTYRAYVNSSGNPVEIY